MNLIHRIYMLTLLLIIASTTINALDSRDIVILILSQDNEYNSKIAHKLEKNIVLQSNETNYIYLSHRNFSHNGDWTILPILPKIYQAHNAAKWLFVCNENTQINLEKLLEVLRKYNSTEEQFLGHALYDRDVTIIHHFAFYEDPTKFLYPNIPSGFAISMPLLQKIIHRFMNENPENQIEFSIDPAHEFSLYIWDQNKGPSLTHEPNFCINNNKNCATYVIQDFDCGDPIPINSIYFGVKTCQKFHSERLKIVQNTWAKYTESIQYFSDVSDSNIPTVYLNIPNTEHGHCAKTFAIINHAYNEMKKNSKIKWIIITDDDTIISPKRLQNMLSCYKTSKILALGERYGYRVQTLIQKGYNYITGGGGTVLSRGVIEKIVQNIEKCSCPKIDTPDDMFLGVCLARLAIKITHSPLFHQARPTDYAPETLSQNTISFHKHWMVDPMVVYEEWFKDYDAKYVKTEL